MRRLLLAVPMVLLLVAPAQGAQVTIGSDLKAPATISYADGNDWAAWNSALPEGMVVQSPVQGEINTVQVKGFMRLEGSKQAPPNVPGYGGDVDVVLHVAVLRPQPDGRVAMVNSSVSQDLPLPLVQDPDQVNTYGRAQLDRPDGPDGKGGTRICIQKGDYIAYAPTGGFGGNAQQNPEQIYTDGAHFQVFGAARTGSASNVFEAGGAFDSNPFRAAAQDGRELLLNATIGTREDARYTCRTKAEQGENLDSVKPTPTVPGGGPAPAPVTLGVATLVAPGKAPAVKGKKVKLSVRCSSAGPCAGTLGLRTYAGTKPFALDAGKTGTVRLTLNTRAAKKLKRKGARLTVKVMLVNTAGAKSSLRMLIRKA